VVRVAAGVCSESAVGPPRLDQSIGRRVGTPWSRVVVFQDLVIVGPASTAAAHRLPVQSTYSTQCRIKVGAIDAAALGPFVK